MATLYVDLSAGNDANPGTAGSPLLTINAAHAVAGGPHDIRVAKTTAASTVGGAVTLTWTENSTSVGTSSTLVGTINVGDYIGKTSAAGNGAAETYYRVSAISAVAITLHTKYQGTTGTTSGCLRVVPVTTGTAAANAVTITTSGTTISGGWNLTGTPTQDGETWAKSNNAWTTAVAFFLSGVNVTISKFNVAETYYSVNTTSGSPTITLNDCTFYNQQRSLFLNTATNTLTADSCVFQAVTQENIYYATSNANTQTFTDCYIYNGTVGLRFGVGSNLAMTGSTIAGPTTGMNSNGYPADVVLTGNTIKNCTTGYSVTFNGQRITGGTFSNNTIGIGASTLGNLWIRDATFTNNTTGIGTRLFGMRVENCAFTGGTNHIYLDQYSSQVEIFDCTFTTPGTNAVYVEDACGTVLINNCTSGSLTPLRETSGFIHNNPNYILKNSFLTGANLVDGTYWPSFSVTKDTGTFRVTAPSMKVQASSTVSTNYSAPIKVGSSYFPESAVGVEGRDVSVYLKCNSTWTGSITPVLRLNGRTVSTETAITSLTTSWVQYTYSFAMGDLDEDGELTLEFIYNNASLIAFFFDDVEWTVT